MNDYEGIIYLLVIVGIYLLYKRLKKRSIEPIQQVRFEKTCSILDKLNEYRQQLYAVEQAITLIEATNARQLKGVTILIPDATGEQIEVNLLCGDSDSRATNILKVLYDEREHLRNNISILIKQLGGKYTEVSVTSGNSYILPKNKGND